MSLFERMKTKNKVEDQAATPHSNGVVLVNSPEAAEAVVKQLDLDAAYEKEKARVAAQDAAAAAAKPKKEKPVKAAKPVVNGIIETANQQTIAPNAVVPTGFTLWLDCTPCGESNDFTRDVDLFAVAHARIRENLNLDDYRFGEFGSGPGILRQMVTQILDEKFASITNLVVDTRTPEAQICLTLFKARSARSCMSLR